MLVSFGAVLVTLLAFVFPTGREYAAFTSQTPADAYSISYLEVLTRANPRELDLRLVYARQLAVLGRFDDAGAALVPVLADARLGNEARHFALDVSLAKARTISETDPARAAAFEDVHRALRELVGMVPSPARGEELAKLALALDDPALAADYFRLLVDMDSANAARHYASAGRWLRAGGDNDRAAIYYLEARNASKSEDEAIGYALEAVAALEADNRVPVAADVAAQQSLRYRSSAALAAAAARLATACTRAAPARELGRHLLTLVPDDETIMREQVDRELAAGDPRAALALLVKLVARKPNDWTLRYRRARVAEWAGDLDTAERDLLWLVAHPKEAR